MAERCETCGVSKDADDLPWEKMGRAADEAVLANRIDVPDADYFRNIFLAMLAASDMVLVERRTRRKRSWRHETG